jgi:hypothetical protein
MILIRYLLICLIGFLLVRTFVNFRREDKDSAVKDDTGRKDKVPQKKVSKEVGEYIDYEELKK